MAVAGATITATPPFTMMFTPAEMLAPGSGLCTVIVCVPACALVAVPATVNCVDETYVVVSAVAPIYATAVCAKCKPVRVIVNAPWAMLIGATLVNCGTGLFRIAAAFPSFLASDVSAALMVMEFGVGGNSGAVYIPFAPMVPRVAFPPAIPLIDQFTAGFDPSPVFAVNCCRATPGIDVPEGVTVSAVSPGPPAGPGSLGRIAWAQPPSNTTSAASNTSAERFTAFPPSIPPYWLHARTCSFKCVGRFKLRRDWYGKSMGVNRSILLNSWPDSEQLVRCPSKV